MTYRHLPEHLRSVAEAAKAFFRAERGVSQFKVEEEFDKKVSYRPTLHANTRDHYFLCVEVLETPYKAVLDGFVLDCVSRCLPVKLYVAFPGDSEQKTYKEDVDRARSNGVGALEISKKGDKIIHEAVSLSLFGLRPIDKKKFSPKYRSPIASAETAFRGGTPEKGCSLVYDEIEDLSRKIAKKTRSKGLWRSLKADEKPPKIKLDKGPWARVMETLIEHLDYRKCPFLKRSLLSRVLGVTAHRNETGHKPRTLKELMSRDGELRTRFEAAVDILVELIKAAKPLRV